MGINYLVVNSRAASTPSHPTTIFLDHELWAVIRKVM